MSYQTQRRAVNILKSAAKNIESNGWCQGEERKQLGKTLHYCAVGSVNEALKNFSAKDKFEARNIAVDTLDKVARAKGFDGIVDLNDDFKTDKRKVLRVFNKAIETLTTV